MQIPNYIPTNRIENEATSSGFFSEYHICSPKDFDDDFKEKHMDFINQNEKGYGNYIWKPYLIWMTLQSNNYGDILVWSDSGMVIEVKGYNRCKDYYKYLYENPNKDILSFVMLHNEQDWNKRDTINAILGDSEIDSLAKYPKQCTANLIFIKKTDRTVKFVNEFWSFASQYNLIDLSPSILPNYPSFKEHRREQSIYSLLLKKYAEYVIFCTDNYEDKNNNYEILENGQFRPFLPYRKRN